jgi:hypothetical protein
MRKISAITSLASALLVIAMPVTANANEDGLLLDSLNRSASFKNWGLRIGGRVDSGVTYNANDPEDKSNGPTSYADRDSELQMNQLYLFAEKAVDRKKHAWDFGGRVDFMFGTDAYKTQAYNQWDSRLIDSENERFYDIAFPQAYAEILAPVGNGLSIKAGHFYTIVGKEGVMAPSNFFYSRNYSFTWAGPFTHSGVLLNYPINQNFSIDSGAVMGWDNITRDSGAWNYLGGVSWKNDFSTTSSSLHIVTGPYDDSKSGNRTRYTFLFNHDFTPFLHYTFQQDYAFQDNMAQLGGGTADWYGVNNYLLFDIDDELAAGLRAEWFRDADGVRVTQNTRGGPLNGASSYYALTGGVNWKPMKWVNVRPEVRYDWADNANAFDSGNQNDQFTFSADVILHF